MIHKLQEHITIQELFDGTIIKRTTPINNDDIIDKLNEIVDYLNCKEEIELLKGGTDVK